MESLTGGKIVKLDTNKCSRDCCLHTQWPAPHMPKKKVISILVQILCVTVV